jgi:hypothetical protein
MNNLVPLNNVKHAKVKIKPSTDYSRFKDQQLVPVVLTEFTRMASEFPIVFVKNTDTGQFVAVAMMGLKAQQNLYCQYSIWTAPVTPLSFTNAPFSFAKESETSEKMTLCLNEECELVNKKSGEALFTNEGEQTNYLKKRTESLLNFVEASQQTQVIIQLLADKKLFTQRQFTVKLAADSEPCKIEGMYIIDEQVLNKLSNKNFNDLKTKGLLGLIYAHLTSIHQITRLVEKHQQTIYKTINN